MLRNILLGAVRSLSYNTMTHYIMFMSYVIAVLVDMTYDAINISM